MATYLGTEPLGPDPAPDSVPAGTEGVRVAARLGSDYFLRSLSLLQGLGWGDLMTSLVCMAILQANVGHLDAPGGPGRQFADGDPRPPDDVRRPVSVLAVAANLGIPYETARRHVAKLIKAGLCVRVSGGVMMPAEAMDTPAHREVQRANVANLRRLYRNLAAAGLDMS